MIQPLQTAHPRFKRPAAIEIRFLTKGEQLEAANRYSEALGLGNLPFLNSESISFPVGLRTIKDGKIVPHSMELSLLIKPELSNLTIVYWEINATDSDGLKKVHQDLMHNHNYTTVEPPPDSSIKAQNDYFLTAERSLLTDKTGTLVGLIINPRYPIQGGAPSLAGQASLSNPEKGVVQRSGYHMATAGVIGLLIGFFANRLGKK